MLRRRALRQCLREWCLSIVKEESSRIEQPPSLSSEWTQQLAPLEEEEPGEEWQEREEEISRMDEILLIFML